MKDYPDSTMLVHMNIPGTHDSSTWNYSQATQDSLLHITAVDGVVPSPAAIYRCQELSYFDMLNMGIRAFDIRYSFDATNSSLVVYHSAALQSETALLSDIMFRFYQWLDDHPSETLLLSFSRLDYSSNSRIGFVPSVLIPAVSVSPVRLRWPASMCWDDDLALSQYKNRY